MLVVAIAEKSQRNRFMLESRARQRYERDRMQKNGLITICGRVYHPRLPYDMLDRVALYANELDKVIEIRFHREIKVRSG